ncbi:MAG: hypothetical protein ABEJ36_00455 [Candidatus Nanosalina sp.]
MNASARQSTEDSSAELLMATEEDFEFGSIQDVLHGEYHQATGTIELDEAYDVTVTERDDNYFVQVRGDNGIIDQAYVDSENPYEELPESDEELYDLVREDILGEPI